MSHIYSEFHNNVPNDLPPAALPGANLLKRLPNRLWRVQRTAMIAKTYLPRFLSLSSRKLGSGTPEANLKKLFCDGDTPQHVISLINGHHFITHFYHSIHSTSPLRRLQKSLFFRIIASGLSKSKSSDTSAGHSLQT
jgi:hypothetical protein